MGFEYGVVVLVPFPFTDQAGVKQRPAIIISSTDYAEARPDIIIMAITSRLRPALGFAEYVIANWQAAGLLKPSLIKPVVATIEQNLVRGVLGKITGNDAKGLKDIIQIILGQANDC